MNPDNQNMVPDTQNKKVIEEALKYISLGLSPIPLGSITKNELGKKVIEYPKDGWKKYRENMATAAEISEWKCINLGIVTGKGLLVLDADFYKESFDHELFESFNLPVTPVQETASGGKQYFFKLPDGLVIKNDVCIGTKNSGIDIRAEGGMVICSPSKTVYGEYKWLISPFNMPMAEVSPKLLELLTKDGPGDKSKKIRKKLQELVTLNEGEGRNNAIAALVGKLLPTAPEDRWDEEILPVALAINKTYNPPQGDEDVIKTYESIVKKEKERRLNLKLSIENIKKIETDFETQIKIKNSLREILKNNQKQGIWVVAEYLISNHNIKTIGNRDNTKDIYLYRDGVYKVDYGLIREEILDITQDLVGSHFREEVMKVIKEKTYKERRYFIIDPSLINFKNGVYDIQNKKLLPHSPEYLFLHQIPIIYDENADCPKIKKFLNEILDEESVRVIQEWFGYCLHRSYFIKKATIFLGERDTGKTTLLKVLEKFLGGENISGVSLQKISSDRFALSNLFQKQANIYDDLSFKDIKDNGVFKMLTGSGTVTGEKKFGDQFQFRNYAKLTFSCNKIPKIADTDDEAYFNRWILIRFEHKPEKPDKFLFEKITTEVEMSGL